MSAERDEMHASEEEEESTAVVQNGSDGDNVARNAEAEQEQQRPAQGNRLNIWGVIKTLAFRMIFIYGLSSLFRRAPAPTTETGMVQEPSSNLFPKGLLMDMHVYLSESEVFTDFKNPKAQFWVKKGLSYGDWTGGPEGDGSFERRGQISLTESMMNNGSIYLHVYFTKSGVAPDSPDTGFPQNLKAYSFQKLNKYKKRKFHDTVNLLTGETEAHPTLIKKANSSSYEVLSHWHPNLTINFLDDHSAWVKGHVPPPLDEYVIFQPGTNKYYPVIFFNDYWNLNSDYMPINETTQVLNLTLTYSPISLFRWQLYAAQNMRNKWYSVLGMNLVDEGEEEQDSVKIAFLETNPYLLAITVIVSIVHSVFEFLAFKNDIQFWKSRKSLEGLSVRSVFFNVFQSCVVVLYVLDNETNMIVKISVIIGLAIEIWKIQKVLDISFDRESKLFGIFPKPIFKEKSTYTESATKKYDMVAFKYLSWGLFPLLAIYAVYSLIYNEHKGWYSFSLSMLYGFLLTFGFIMMTPQLFINYKMKSVAHLPWRMLTYKALNTFIDDIFAFVIKMPTLYRLGCFRDDIVFFIYLYQRYIYRVDPKRVNEFGTSQEMLEQNGSIVEADGRPGKTTVKSKKEKKND